MTLCAAVREVRTNVHTCLLQPSHDPPHQCICGHRWDDEKGKT